MLTCSKRMDAVVVIPWAVASSSRSSSRSSTKDCCWVRPPLPPSEREWTDGAEAAAAWRLLLLLEPERLPILEGRLGIGKDVCGCSWELGRNELLGPEKRFDRFSVEPGAERALPRLIRRRGGQHAQHNRHAPTDFGVKVSKSKASSQAWIQDRSTALELGIENRQMLKVDRSRLLWWQSISTGRGCGRCQLQVAGPRFGEALQQLQATTGVNKACSESSRSQMPPIDRSIRLR